ncbi:MATE efflux family protein [Bacteroidales bacterium Barb4]|nr:MATE efflux family protein [Bacteroidales bacterium Barb4]
MIICIWINGFLLAMYCNRIIKALGTINYRLLVAIFSTMLLPTIYQTVRIFFLGDMPDDQSINIASQLSWINLFYEIIQEALILPLFFLLGNSLGNNVAFENKVRGGLAVTAVIYFVVSGLLVIFARPLTVFMAQDNTLIEATINYIRLETIAALFSILWRFIMLVLITLRKDKCMYILLFIQMLLSIILDTLFISNLDISAKIGVNGIAIVNIIVNVVILIVAVILLGRGDIIIFKKEKLSFRWMKEWFRIGAYSGIESLLRNIVFMIMIIRMINVVSEQGNYWIANNFIWQWLLLPGLALADLVKKEIGENIESIRNKTFGYIILTSIFAFIWLASIPLWKPFLYYVMNVSEYETVFKIVLLQTGFYLTFLFNNSIFDSTFYGVGKTNYMLIQSICINVFYNGIMFILYMKGIFIPSLYGISIMFGVGMALDFIPTMILYLRLLKQRNIKLIYSL